MPAKERRRGDEEGGPVVARDQAAGCRGGRARGRGTSADRSFVGGLGADGARTRCLEVLGPIVSATLATHDDETREGAEDDIQTLTATVAGVEPIKAPGQPADARSLPPSPSGSPRR